MICVDNRHGVAGRERPGEASDETLLLEYVATRDARLFAELVQRYEGELYEYLQRYVGDAELAQDALQSTWLQLHLKGDLFEPGRTLRPGCTRWPFIRPSILLVRGAGIAC